MLTREEVIAKLQAATQGSRDLDADIYEALGVAVIRHRIPRTGITWRWRGSDLGARWQAMRYLTTSLDDALSLAPADMAWWQVGKIMAEDSPARHFGHGKPYRALVSRDWGGPGIPGHAHTAPLALCIAALSVPPC